jgi:hypothetical protein
LKRLRDRAGALCDTGPFAPFFRDWAPSWHYATPESTSGRLARAGFTAIETNLEHTPTPFASEADYRQFVEHVCLRPYLERLPDALRPGFLERLVTLAASDNPPFVLDYWRLNILAGK